jgi:hypothetical protein
VFHKIACHYLVSIKSFSKTNSVHSILKWILEIFLFRADQKSVYNGSSIYHADTLLETRLHFHDDTFAIGRTN